jgi:hypothetical protein
MLHNVARFSLLGVLLANDTQILELCAQLSVCKDDAQCVILVEQLRILIHEHMEALRGALVVHSATVAEIEKAS